MTASHARPGTAALRYAGLLALGFLMAGCARQGAPTGGQPPSIPPSVVGTYPDTFEALGAFRGPVRISYNRPISERAGGGTLTGLVEVSPRLGEVRVRNRGQGIEISMEGGFPADRVFRVAVQPGVRDLYGQATRDPFELVFSTGAPFHPNVVAGVVQDRITGQTVSQARVEAFMEGDSIPISAVTDEEGIFALRYLPAGTLRLVSYQDRARNLTREFTDPQDSLQVAVAEGDTVLVMELALLLPDTTPAELGAAQFQDSLAVRLTFDDHLDPEWDPAGASVRVIPSEGGEEARVQRVVHPAVWDSVQTERRQEQARLEAEAREAAQREALEAARAEARAAAEAEGRVLDEEELEEELAMVPPVLPGAAVRDDLDPAAREGAAGPPRPLTTLYLLLETPLAPEVEYVVTVTGVRNINGVEGGRGEVRFRTPALPPPLEEPEPDEDPNGDGDGSGAPHRSGPWPGQE